jgi:hypothetical protein
LGSRITQWEIIETQSDLGGLDQSVCWEDSRVLEYYGKFSNEAYFPAEVSRSGRIGKNIHILIEADSSIATATALGLVTVIFVITPA